MNSQKLYIQAMEQLLHILRLRRVFQEKDLDWALNKLKVINSPSVRAVVSQRGPCDK